jgi:hypothetical protein
VSPSGRWIAYLSVFHKARALDTTLWHDLAVVPEQGGTVHVLAADIVVQEGNYYRGTYRWHPTRDQLFWVNDQRLWTATPGAGPDAQPLAADLTDVTPAPFGFTRDGTKLIVSRTTGGLPLVPVDGGAVQHVPIPDGFVLQGVMMQDPVTAWQPTAGALTCIVRESAPTQDVVLRVEMATGRMTTLWKGLARIRGVGGPADHSWLAVT